MKPEVRTKTYTLDSRMIAAARRAFNAKTDTEAIHKALRKAIDDYEIEGALDRFLRTARFRTLDR